MNELFIEETKGTPSVIFKADGHLSMHGRSLPLDSIGFFNPILKWVKEISATSVHFSIRLDYLNTSSAKYLYTILQLLKDNPRINSLNIQWYYEQDDEDGYDAGKEFESLVNVPFKFYEFSE